MGRSVNDARVNVVRRLAGLRAPADHAETLTYRTTMKI
jgi:hypothetical protein